MSIYLVNLLFTLATGVWFSLWLIHNTEWFPVVGGALGLGSFFAWIAFILNIISDERKNEFQGAIEQYFFDKKTTTFALALINLTLLFFFPATNASIEVINTSAKSSAMIHLTKTDGTEVTTEPVFIPPQKGLKLLLPVGFLKGDAFSLSHENNPDFTFNVIAGNRKTLVIPENSWQQKFILLVPDTIKTNDKYKIKGEKTRIAIKLCRKDETACSNVFRGSNYRTYTAQPILLGTNKTISVPESYLSSLIARGISPLLTQKWSFPETYDFGHNILKKPLMITELSKPEGGVLKTCKFNIEPNNKGISIAFTGGAQCE